jgi:hypothetical protein
MNKKELLENLQQTHDKYVDLLWYARSGPENETIKGVKENKERIEALYPYEVKELHSENSDWQHGFHSGMVAGLRYISTMDELGVEQAKEEFPELDS